LVPEFRHEDTAEEVADAPAHTSDAIERETIRLFECYSGGVYRFLLRLLRDPELASDLTQECFLRLFRALAKERLADPRAWLFHVAYHLALNERKRHGRLRLVSFDGVPEAELPRSAPSELEERPQSLHELSPGMARLSRQERTCLELRAEGLRYRQIADILGLGVPSVATFVARAIRKLSDYAHRKDIDQ